MKYVCQNKWSNYRYSKRLSDFIKCEEMRNALLWIDFNRGRWLWCSTNHPLVKVENTSITICFCHFNFISIEDVGVEWQFQRHIDYWRTFSALKWFSYLFFFLRFIRFSVETASNHHIQYNDRWWYWQLTQNFAAAFSLSLSLLVSSMVIEHSSETWIVVRRWLERRERAEFLVSTNWCSWWFTHCHYTN